MAIEKALIKTLILLSVWLDEAIALIKLASEGKSLEIAETVTASFSMYKASLTHQTVNKILTDSAEYEKSLAINQEVM